MQEDGNLVLRDAKRTPIWISKTRACGIGPYRLKVCDGSVNQLLLVDRDKYIFFSLFTFFLLY
jgi:hypothetical protein